MKRLRYYFTQMEKSTATYKEIFEGEVKLPPGAPGNDSEFWVVEHDNRYWDDDISFVINESNRKEKDKPTIKCYIPCDKLEIIGGTYVEADFCYRRLISRLEVYNEELRGNKLSDKENGCIYYPRMTGAVLVRNTAYFEMCPSKSYINLKGNIIEHSLEEKAPRECLVVMFQVQLPMGRLKKAMQMLCKDIPEIIRDYVNDFDIDLLKEAVSLYQKQRMIRNWLKDSEYCAFIGNGSILPRSNSGVMPLEKAIPFTAKKENEIEIAGVKGLGIKRGITVITGGGYSGKSTILDAIFAGVYNHIKGDGREYCITDEDAMMITTEEGRSVKRCNISPFISWLPEGNVENFSTGHASGSTSQAANIMEAIEYGSKLLLIDEDKSAANFLIKDFSMSQLIHKEPLVPFSDRVKELFEVNQVSTIMVIGGTGAFLPVAGQVFLTDEYQLFDVTEKAKEICAQNGLKARTVIPSEWYLKHLFIVGEGFTSYPKGSGSERLFLSELDALCIGDEIIDTKGIHGITEKEQLNAMAFLLRKVESICDGEANIQELIDFCYRLIGEKGLDILFSSFFYKMGRFMALPRKQDVYALIKRMREVEIREN